ncbi:MAG: 4Fe-4S binding protein [Euryarchaeota archaeon]|nr:4Fe-4S binding protein [Euryarchaeota archaeon]MBU4607667.1 4Fe-4S binding protein [Euryarchaeota archaeon]MBV1730458.1 4Fe-4S binding protein [Methanobacterium sp.]MBV1755721.1 4Fe-4S binding protein [Methanobacterium sp.]MBV1767240.1 4Fe-4S binding protein [Methanobacterium sp.]
MIFQADLCGYCGACASVCPLGIIELNGYKIEVLEGCNNCKNCIHICPLGAFQEAKKDEI